MINDGFGAKGGCLFLSFSIARLRSFGVVNECTADALYSVLTVPVLYTSMYLGIYLLLYMVRIHGYLSLLQTVGILSLPLSKNFS